MRSLSITGSILLLTLPGTAQGFANNTQDIPQAPPANSLISWAIDFADVDLDGDWDAAFATGLQNRVWINQGGAQGGTVGVFEDETATRFPVVLDASRDVEFADVDKDGDPDLYVSNKASAPVRGSRWLINQGGEQGGTPGYFSDETQTRWIDLGENDGGEKRSSIAKFMLLETGGFIDWNNDSDFADLDNDGHVDLVHSSSGPNTAYGRVPTRIFLNDGDGSFVEFNPSGFQLPHSLITDGDPGLWCEGTHRHGTTNASGSECDVGELTADVDVADTDGDFDIDIVLGSIGWPARLFTNRMSETGGLAFRDTTSAFFPVDYADGLGHYEQELGDFDLDGDLDLFGVAWKAWDVEHVSLEGLGGGFFGPALPLAACDPYDAACELLDYDGDSDLDVFIATSGCGDQLFENVGGSAGSYSFVLTSGILPEDSTIATGDAAADVDADGDTDLFVCVRGDKDRFLENLGTPDVHAPRIDGLEQAPDRLANAEPTVVRCRVYDNAPDYIVGRNTTELQFRVDGGAFVDAGMTYSGGQIFRGEIPGELVGTIEYRVACEDENENVGVSATKTYEASGTCTGAIEIYCTAKTNSCGTLPAIGFSGLPSAAASAGFEIRAEGARAQRSGLLLYSREGEAALPFQGGLLCVSPVGLRRTVTALSGGTSGACDGVFAIDMNAFAAGALGGSPAAYLRTPGTRVFCQWTGRDSAGTGSLLSDALHYLVCP